MTIDERIERLTERHEALAQSVEIVTHDIAALTQSVETTSRDVAALTGHMANMMQAITRPGNTGAIHNLQIQDIESRLTRLEQLK